MVFYLVWNIFDSVGTVFQYCCCCCMGKLLQTLLCLKSTRGSRSSNLIGLGFTSIDQGLRDQERI